MVWVRHHNSLSLKNTTYAGSGMADSNRIHLYRWLGDGGSEEKHLTRVGH